MADITKILFRRGTNVQRSSVILGLGEPGFIYDTQRLYVGDGTTAGGVPVGVRNLGVVAALSGTGTGNLDPTTYSYLAGIGPAKGDIIYSSNNGLVYSLSSLAANSTVPSLSDFAPYTQSQVGYNPTQFTQSNGILNLANNGVGNGNLASNTGYSVKGNFGPTTNNVTDVAIGGSTGGNVFLGNTTGTLGPITLSAGQGGINFATTSTSLGISLSSTANSVKANPTAANGVAVDLTLQQANQFVGRTAVGTLTAVTLSGTGDIGLSVNTNTVTISSNALSKTGGTVTGAINMSGNAITSSPTTAKAWAFFDGVTLSNVTAGSVTITSGGGSTRIISVDTSPTPHGVSIGDQIYMIFGGTGNPGSGIYTSQNTGFPSTTTLVLTATTGTVGAGAVTATINKATVRDSYGISCISPWAAGRYLVNMSTTLSNTSYATVFTSSGALNRTDSGITKTGRTVGVAVQTSTPAYVDISDASILIFAS